MERFKLKRFEAIQKIAKIVKNELIVCNLGIPSKELYQIKDRPENFYMLGSMGLASSIALGIAISLPDRKIWCLDGDGSILMNLGSLSTIANMNPVNLTLIIIDNKSYGSTGNQKTYTSKNTKLDVIAKGAGFENISVITEIDEIIPTLKNLESGSNFVLIKTEPGNAEVENIPLNPVEIKERFMKSIL